MPTIRLTPHNAHQYIGHDISCIIDGRRIIKRILNVSRTGKLIQIDLPEQGNFIQIVTRDVDVFI